MLTHQEYDKDKWKKKMMLAKRSLNVRQISRLAKRFHVSPDVFLES